MKILQIIGSFLDAIRWPIVGYLSAMYRLPRDSPGVFWLWCEG